jgi:hypothetical protein
MVAAFLSTPARRGFFANAARDRMLEPNRKTILVRRDQFCISPQGIVHKPTDAAFTPHPGDPFSGIERLGQLGDKGRTESGFRAEDVHRMMRELWAEYVTANPQLLNHS